MKKINNLLIMLVFMISTMFIFGCSLIDGVLNSNQNEENVINNKEKEDDAKEDNKNNDNENNDDENHDEKKTFTVIFDTNGGYLSSGKKIQTVSNNSEIVPPVFEKTNYLFDGWNVDLNEINHDVTVYALWKKAIITHVVNFYKSIGNGEKTFLSSISCKNNSLITPINVELVNDELALGWYNGDKEWDFENDYVTSDIDLVLKIQAKPYLIVMNLIDKLNKDNIFDVVKEYNKLTTEQMKLVKNYNDLKSYENFIMDIEIKNIKTYEDLECFFDKFTGFDFSDIDFTEIYKNVFYNTYSNEIKSIDKSELMRRIAFAYLYKGNKNQYDQSRRAISSSPYDASIYNILYFDCSSFCYNMYEYAFYGEHNVQTNTANNDSYAKKHTSTADVVYYIETKNYNNVNDQDTLLQEIYNNLQVGDLVNYRHGKSSGTKGHVVMYIGNGLFIHSTGDDMTDVSYDNNPDNFYEVQTEKEKIDGTIFTFSANELFFDKSSYRYLFKMTESDTVYSFSVLRPLNTCENPTDKAITNYILGYVDIEKTYDVPNLGSAIIGRELTYTITFNNYSDNTYYHVPIIEEIPQGMSFVSCNYDGKFINDSIYYLVDIAPNTKTCVTYTLKVNDKYKNAYISDNFTYVCDVCINNIYHMYSGEYNRVLLRDTLESNIKNINKYEATYDLIKETYETVSPNCLSRVFGAVSSFSYFNKDSYFMSANNNCLLINVSTGLVFDYNYSRLIRSNLEIGDIMTTYNKVTKMYKTYIVVSSDSIATVENGIVKVITGENMDKVLDRFGIYNKYYIYRPICILSK